MIEFLDPRAEPGAPIDPYELATDTDGPIDIGLLANGFPDSVDFLEALAVALSDHVPGATFHRYDKGDATSVVSDAMLDSIVAECRAVVAAYGH